MPACRTFGSVQCQLVKTQNSRPHQPHSRPRWVGLLGVFSNSQMPIVPGRLTSDGPADRRVASVACILHKPRMRASLRHQVLMTASNFHELFFSNNSCRMQNEQLVTDIVSARHKTTYRQFLPTSPHNAEITLTSSVLPSRCKDRIQWSPKLVSHSYPSGTMDNRLFHDPCLASSGSCPILLTTPRPLFSLAK